LNVKTRVCEEQIVVVELLQLRISELYFLQENQCLDDWLPFRKSYTS